MPKHWTETRWLGLVLCLYLVLGVLYAAYTPAWQAPDEPAHYNYIRHIAETGRLPVLQPGDYPAQYLEQVKAAGFPADMPVDSLRYEAWQPPLYYLLATPIYQLGRGALLPLRLFSLLLGGGVVTLAYFVAARLWPNRWALWVVCAAVVAFVPMHLAVVTSVNNDVLAELLIGLVLWRSMVWLERPVPSLGGLAVSGVLLGLALLTKATSIYVAVPAAVAAVWLVTGKPGQLARRWVALLLPALGLALPWIVRNLLVYGWPDVLGKINHDAVVVGQLRTADYVAEVGWLAYGRNFVSTSFHSFWGQFGWMAVPMERRVYLLLAILSALAAVGCLLVLAGRVTGPSGGSDGEATSQSRLGNRTRRKQYLLLAVWLLLTVLGYLYYNVTFVQFQGRYLFPALIPVAVFLTAGWYGIAARQWAWLAAGVSVAVTAGDALIGGLSKWALVIGAGTTIAWLLRSRLKVKREWLVLLPAGLLLLLAAYSLPAYIMHYL